MLSRRRKYEVKVEDEFRKEGKLGIKAERRGRGLSGRVGDELGTVGEVVGRDEKEVGG